MAFTVTPESGDTRTATVRLAGELDMSTVPVLDTAITQLVGTGRNRLVVDLAELAFCDSTGLACLVRGDNRCAADGGWLRVTNHRGHVARVLAVSGLDEFLQYEAP
ncbi:STAS domain-containing protein [Catenuloplanes sp. NPDC051500]|uniref:STAS domain-containing protein n=1 Tax=Catenuloplanes sp. NPDC051500 TaxID=3363959 RepID=UPI0037B8B9E5